MFYVSYIYVVKMKKRKPQLTWHWEAGRQGKLSGDRSPEISALQRRQTPTVLATLLSSRRKECFHNSPAERLTQLTQQEATHNTWDAS